MIGAPFSTARSITLQIFSALVSESDPPNTVKSCAKTKTLRPSTVPAPDTTPSPGTRDFSIPKSRERCSTSESSSKKEPGSRRSSTRSRAVSFPSACWRAVRSGPPPARLRARRASRSAMRFSTVKRTASEDYPALLGELPSDPAQELLPVHSPRRDLAAGAFHHPARLLVQGALLFRLGRERRDDRVTQRAGSLLLEELARG